jgi:hypothetical protein
MISTNNSVKQSDISLAVVKRKGSSCFLAFFWRRDQKLLSKFLSVTSPYDFTIKIAQGVKGVSI